MTEFTHLHVHSDYSLLDGLGRIPLMTAEARRHGMSAIALTDHGAMFGAIDFYESAKDSGVKPIIGLEAYVTDGSRFDRSGAAFHLTLLAENEVGYSNLMQLTTKAHLEGFYRKPRVDHELLELHRDGIVCLSGCPSSEICRALRDENEPRASELADWYARIYEGRFYIEVQDHGLDFQPALTAKLLALAAKHGLPVVATNDVHYVRKDQASVHEVLLCVQTQTTMSDPKRMRIGTDELYLKSATEMIQRFGHIPGAVQNSMAIAERCNLDLRFGQTQLLPSPSVPDGIPSHVHLKELCAKGIQKRYASAEDPEVRDRLTYELSVIEATGYVDYMLLVNEFIQFAKQRGIAIGVRGSAGGSIVAYALGVTDVDPLKLGLSFERFLNPERVSMPDIDIDIADDRRDELLQYVTDRFGRDRVAQIISFGTMAARAALRDVGRATGVQLGLVDQAAKLIPFNADLSEAIEKVPELRTLYDEQEAVRQLIDTARELEGVARHASTHAAGVVISSRPLVDHVPLYKVPKAEIVTTQYAMSPLDKLGLLKMDFLGLRTLSILQRAASLVSETTGRTTKLADLPLDDPEAFALLGRGETFGVFQVDGSGMRRLLRDMQPDRFDDIIALIALYRPGPMQFIDEFVKRRRGTNAVEYPHPVLASALEETFGIVVYQEQVVRMVVEVAGFTMGEADLVRKAMAKKQPDLLAKYRKDFVSGATEKGTSRKDADQLFDIIQDFSGYGFNKAHSAAYAVITLQTAYLKAHHPVEYLAAYLSAERENADKVAEAMSECRRLRIPVLAPNVNYSQLDFSIEGETGGVRSIRFGLGAVRNVGSLAANSIIHERQASGEFNSIGDLCRRLDWQQVNKRTLESLIKCGALDDLGDRSRLNFNLERLVAYGTRAARDAASGQVSLFGDADSQTIEPHLESGEPDTESARLRWEKEMIGAYLSRHPLQDSEDRLRRLGIRSIADIEATDDGQTLKVAGILSAVRQFQTKRGDPMASASLQDLDATMGVVLYPKVFRRSPELICDDSQVVIEGVVALSDGEPELRVESIWRLDSSELEELASEDSSASEASTGSHETAGVVTASERQPIPFPGPRGGSKPSRIQGRLMIHFERSDNQDEDLERIMRIYSLILKYPGTDRIVVVVHSHGLIRNLQLPIDTARVTASFRTALEEIVPATSVTVDEILA